MKFVGEWALLLIWMLGVIGASLNTAQADVVQTGAAGDESRQVRVIGKVLNTQGEPVAKAAVALYRNSVNREQLKSNYGMRPAATTTADVKGSFTIPLTSSYGQTIVVSAPGYLDEIDVLSQDHTFNQKLRNAPPGTTFTRKIVLQKADRRTGIVADENGKPLPGVKVQAYPLHAPSPQQGTYGTRFGETETDGDGRFVLSGVPAGGLTLFFSAPGYATNYLSVPAEQKEIAINLSRGATVTGTVVEFASSNPMEQVWVQVSSINEPNLPGPKEPRPYPHSWAEVALTGESGNFLLRNVPPGEYAISISQNQNRDGHQLAVWNPGSTNYIKLTVPETGDPAPVQVPVFTGYTLSGSVVEAGTTATVPGAMVWLMSTHPHTRVQADANGCYEFKNLFDRGMIRVTATADGYEMVNPNNYISNSTVTLTVELPTTGTRAHFNIPMNRQQIIKGTVMDAATSTPLQGATVQITGDHFSNNNMPQQQNTSVLSGTDGRFEIPLYPGDSVRLRATLDGYAPTVSDPIRTRMDQDVVFAMQRGVTVDGIVLDPGKKPVAEARVYGSVTTGESQPSHSNRYNEPVQNTNSGPDGRFHLENIMPGATLTIYAQKKDFAVSEPQSYVTLAGENVTSVVLPLRKGTYLAGHVYDTAGKPLKDVNLYARSVGTYGYSNARTADDGSYRMTGVPEAPVDVTINHYQHGMEVFYDVGVGREDADFKFGTGDKNGMKRYEHERERNKKDKSGITLRGKAVDYKSGVPVKDIKVVGTSRMDITLDPDKPGEFTVHGLMISSPYQSIKIYAPGYAPYDSGSLYIFPGEKLIEKTFKLGPGGSVIGRAVEQGTDKPVPGVIVTLGADLISANRNSSGEQVMPVITGADGQFNLTGVGQGRKVVEFQPPPETGFVKMSQPVDVVYNEATDLKDVEFGSGGTIRGKLVRTPGDLPIPNAQVTMRDGKSATTDADGAFEFTDLVNGLYYLEAPQYGANLWVGIDQLQTKEVTLEVGTGKLIGLVTRAGQPVSCSVKLQKVGYGQSVARNATSDSAGRFIIEGLAPGRWSVQFSKAGGAAFSAADAVVMPETGESVEKTFALPSATLQVTVMDAGGTAVEGATVIVRQEQAAGSVISGDGKTRQTSANGIASFDGLEAGSYSITATDRDGLRGAKHNVAVQENGSVAETITLESAPGGTLVSTALNLSSGKPVPSAWCYLFNDKGQMFEHANQRDEMGVMTIENIPPGTYRAQVSAFSFSVSEKTVEIRAGETQSIDDVLYPAGALRWALRDASGAPVVGAACTLKPADANSVEGERSGVSNAAGVFIARGLMQGAYIAEAKGPGGTARAMINIYAGNATDEVTLLK